MENEEKDLKLMDQDPSGNDLPEKDTTDESQDVSDTTEAQEEEKVVLSKAEYEKLQEERDNYKKGMLKAKLSSRKLPGSEPERKDSVEESSDGFWGEETEYVTKKDLQKIQERQAIKTACEQIPELDKNWDEIIGYYYPKNGKTSEEGIMEDLKDAVDLWKVRTGFFNKTKDNSKDIKKTTQTLASDKGVHLGEDKVPQIPKKHIIKSNVGMDRWYDKKD